MVYSPGLLAGRLSGTAGSTSATANRFGTSLHVSRRPVDVRSRANALARARFSSAAQAFKTLSTEQLAAWSSLAPRLVVTGRLSRRYSLSPSTAFLLVNRNRLTLGLSIELEAPAYVLPTPISGIELTVHPT